MSMPASAAPVVPAPGNLSALLFDPAAAERLFSLLNPVFAPGEGLVVQFISANGGEGVSTLARDFALMATQYIDGDVLLLDLSGSSDVNSQFSHFQQCGASDPMLALSAPQPLAPTECGPLLRLPNRDCDNAHWQPLLSYHRLGESRLLVSRTRPDLPDTPRVANQPRFWAELRRTVMLTVVDTPPPSRSFDGIILCGAMDAVLLVVAAESTRVPVVEELRDTLLSQGANLAGVVLNRRRLYIPRVIYRILGRI